MPAAGGEPLSAETPYLVPRAYDDDGSYDGQLVSVVVARVVGIVDPGDEDIDESDEARPVHAYWNAPVPTGRPMPWIDGGERRWAAMTKQQRSLLRWRPVSAEQVERCIARSTHTYHVSSVVRAQKHCSDALCHRYSRAGYRLCDREGDVCLPRPLLGEQARLVFPLRAPRPPRPPPRPPRPRPPAAGAEPRPPPPPSWRQAAAQPWLRLQRAMRAHREMAVALGWSSADVRDEFAAAQQMVNRAMMSEGILPDDTEDEYEEYDDYGYVVPRVRGSLPAAAFGETPRARLTV